ncbi:MAG: hypothetical protein AAGL09_18795, partial [Pseudomonadota bacterium]
MARISSAPFTARHFPPDLASFAIWLDLLTAGFFDHAHPDIIVEICPPIITGDPSGSEGKPVIACIAGGNIYHIAHCPTAGAIDVKEVWPGPAIIAGASEARFVVLKHPVAWWIGPNVFGFDRECLWTVRQTV